MDNIVKERIKYAVGQLTLLFTGLLFLGISYLGYWGLQQASMTYDVMYLRGLAAGGLGATMALGLMLGLYYLGSAIPEKWYEHARKLIGNIRGRKA